MTILGSESSGKLRDMGASCLIDAVEAQDDDMCMGMTFAERMQMAVDEAHSAFVDGKSTIFCTQYQKKDWHARLRGGVHADAIMDGIVHNAVWLDSGEVNMRAKLSNAERQKRHRWQP